MTRILTPICLLALGVSFGLIPSSASATHACTGAAGEVMVGEQPAGGGVATIPLCDWANASNSQNPALQKWGTPYEYPSLAPGWDALVVDNVKYVSITIQGAKSRKEAISEGMAECKAKGGTSCKVLSSILVPGPTPSK